MTDRKREKVGWTGGFLGGFLWVLMLSVVFLFQGSQELAVQGFVITAIAVVGVLYFSPWRFPSTPYWRLMLLPYGMFFVSAVWAIWAYGGPDEIGFSWWSLLMLLPVLMPIGSLYNKRWLDFEGQEKS
jgi:hypothetical protein